MDLAKDADETGFAKTIAETKVKKTTAIPAHGEAVPLAEATDILQPVLGTSSGSVYIVLAVCDGVNIAGRLTHGKLSLRCEGPKLATYLPCLKDVGFSHKIKDKYASVHFEIDEDSLAMKTFGAVLGRLGFNAVKKAVDNVAVIKGMGK